jgi:putative NIF3 family GTP cyclohydrolase 1 type 2
MLKSNRREFIALAVASGSAAAASEQPLLARHVKDYLWSLADWVNFKETVDTFKAGSPETPVKGIAVAWMSYTSALKRALELNCNLFITHEPTYYDHNDNREAVFRHESARAKREFIQNSGIVILRCHDVWDQYPKLGIPDGWATTLGFSRPVAGSGYFRVFDVSGRTALDVARQVASKTRPWGQEAVQLIGPPNAAVHRVAIGCGAITPYLRFLREFNADLAICTDDGFTYWRDGAFAMDSGIPAILVNHPVAEAPAMALLADHLKRKYPQVPVHSLAQGCMYKLVK